MTEVWGSPMSWTHEQWLIVIILAFIVIAIAVLIYRLLTIVKTVNTKRELPNLRPGRRPRGSHRNPAAQPGSGAEEESEENAEKPSSNQSADR